jgi:hypothetical protein
MRSNLVSQTYQAFFDMYGFPDESIPIYASTNNTSEEYLRALMYEVLRYPIHIIENNDNNLTLSEKVKLNNEIQHWQSTLIRSYLTVGIDTNDIIQFFDWSLRYACKASGINIPQNINVGVLPMATVNAQCLLTNNNEYLIFVDAGCLAMIESISALIFSTSSEVKVQDVSEIILNYTETGKVADSHDRLKRLKRINLIERTEIIVVVQTMFFVLLHEYGHIINGHLDLQTSSDSESTDFVYSLGKQSISVIFKDTIKEFEADIWATYSLFSFSKLINSDNEVLTELSLVAPVLFLGIAMLIESAYRLKEVQIDRHPPAFDRIDISDIVFEVLGAGRTGTIRGFVGNYIISVHNALYDSVIIASIMPMEMYESIQKFIKVVAVRSPSP